MYKSYLLDLNKTELFMFMINIIKQDIPIGKSNLAYIEPYKRIINNIMFLVFNYSNDVYIKNFGNKIKINELENYLKHTN